VTLQVEGRLTGDAADLLEGVCGRLVTRPDVPIVVDLSGIAFLSEEGVTVLRRLKKKPRIRFDGCCLFTEQVLDQVHPY
jgi:hypothetical protein